ncbi:hypothetical protein PRUPE_1G215100 [Prunus persica]|uniref:PB1-like domain-containing protein n=1 Tax=Prunus persica TaxID=3760 RepID=A0A251R285_PRUPE|nr:hypothetical protein PRUPE_1G215100 [Prunus persica]
MPREKGGSQPEYDDKGIVTFEVHHGGKMVKSQNLNEWWFYVGGSVDYLDWCLLDYINLLEINVYAKELGHHDQVVVTGIQNDKKVCIDSDVQLLDWCNLVPPSFQRVIVIYLEHPTIISVDESAVAWSERGPIARNLYAEFEQSGYEDMYEEDEEDEKDEEDEENCIAVDEEDEGDEGTVHEPIHVEEAGDEGIIPEGTVHEGITVDEEDDEGTVPDGINMEDETIYEEGENDKRAENDCADSEDPEFYDSAYDQSEDEQCLLEKDDRAFDNYVDHNAPDFDPAADEGEKLEDMVVSDEKKEQSSPNFFLVWPSSLTISPSSSAISPSSSTISPSSSTISPISSTISPTSYNISV